MEYTRRQLCTGALAAALAASVPGFAQAGILKPSRSLKFENLHTNEKLAVTYWENGAYVKGALSEINWVLRDHRTGQVATIDPALLDQLHLLQRRLDTSSGYEVFSGFRSPLSNSVLRMRSSGVAKKSLHMEGKAIDIRVPGRELSQLYRAARSMERGGVGFYPRSDFVHLDTGAVRHW